MKLENYLKSNEIPRKRAASELGVSEVSVLRWIHGSRFPKPQMVQKILVWSNGKVRPEDFYARDAA